MVKSSMSLPPRPAPGKTTKVEAERT